jgi:hypothetical protein
LLVADSLGLKKSLNQSAHLIQTPYYNPIAVSAEGRHEAENLHLDANVPFGITISTFLPQPS